MKPKETWKNVGIGRKVRREILGYYIRLFVLFIGLTLSLSSFAASDTTPVKVDLIAEEKTIQPGRPFWIALRLNIEKDWHVYWKNPGDAGLPLTLDWQLPSGFKADASQWPFPEKFNLEDMVGFGYENEVTLLTLVTPPATLPAGQEVKLAGEAKWLVCSSMTCQPGSAPISLTIKTASELPEIDQKVADIFKEARESLPKSQISVKTIHKEGIVQLQVPTIDLSHQEVTGVSFFPEEQNIIDSTVDPVVSIDHNKKSEKGYFVNLKGGEEIGGKAKQLKGVLVVHTKDDPEGVAFDIDSPIEDNTQDFLSFVDSKSFLKNQTEIGSASPSISSAEFEGGIGLALLFAFVGGSLLNLMPCVLPVMSFKVMSFVKMAGQSRSLTIKHGLFFSLGVVISFWILATLMLVLRTYGQAVGWGFQLQEPLFVVILASLLFVFALSLFGVFEWGLFVSSWAGQTQVETSRKSGYMASFLGGVMATAVATPCTGPFLGSAVGFAVTLPIFQSLLIFTSLGLGMSSPYLILAAFPGFLRFMPKPGAWMEIFKQLMGFLLLATVLWLLWVFSAQTNSMSLICLLAGFLCFSIGAWLYGQGSSPLASKTKRWISYICVMFMVAGGIQTILIPRASWYSDAGASHSESDKWAGWEKFSPERVAELQKQGTPFLIDFTAKWCLICQANHMVLEADRVKNKLEEEGVVKLVADWTKSDPSITEALSKFGRSSVPLYVVYGKDAGKEPLVLPQVLTVDNVIEHLDQALLSDEVALK